MGDYFKQEIFILCELFLFQKQGFSFFHIFGKIKNQCFWNIFNLMNDFFFNIIDRSILFYINFILD